MALHQSIYGVMGADLTAIPTIGIETVLIIASEIGANLSRFPDEANFCSWLNVAPPTCISGGKGLKGQKPQVFNRSLCYFLALCQKVYFTHVLNLNKSVDR